METMTCRTSSDRLSITSEGGILTATVSGLLGATECIGALWQIRRAAAAPEVCGVLVDMRGAALALSVPQYVEVLRFEVLAPIQQRMALVVGDGLISLARAHEIVLARRGLQRRFYTTRKAALHWLGAAPPPQCREGSLL